MTPPVIEGGGHRGSCCRRGRREGERRLIERERERERNVVLADQITHHMSPSVVCVRERERGRGGKTVRDST